MEPDLDSAYASLQANLRAGYLADLEDLKQALLHTMSSQPEKVPKMQPKLQHIDLAIQLFKAGRELGPPCCSVAQQAGRQQHVTPCPWARLRWWWCTLCTWARPCPLGEAAPVCGIFKRAAGWNVELEWSSSGGVRWCVVMPPGSVVWWCHQLVWWCNQAPLCGGAASAGPAQACTRRMVPACCAAAAAGGAQVRRDNSGHVSPDEYVCQDSQGG